MVPKSKGRLVVGPPKHLSAQISDIWSEIHQDYWDHIGIAGLEAVCVLVHTAREAQQRLEADGMIVNDGKGNPIPHPAIAIHKSATDSLRSWTHQFGKGISK